MMKSSFLIYLFLQSAASFHIGKRLSGSRGPSHVVIQLDPVDGSLADSAAVVGSDEVAYDPMLDESIAGKFKIRTCASASCTERRRQLHLDEFATYSAFYVMIQGRAPSVSIEESPCLGSCRLGPCVAIEHDEYDGPVSVEGMTPDEFAKRVFVNVDAVERVERVWSCVENAIRSMAEPSPTSGRGNGDLGELGELDLDLGSVAARSV
jgi:(2Fe-2S) ferredoxin